jgi:hypothetical protein
MIATAVKQHPERAQLCRAAAKKFSRWPLAQTDEELNYILNYLSSHISTERDFLHSNMIVGSIFNSSPTWFLKWLLDYISPFSFIIIK